MTTRIRNICWVLVLTAAFLSMPLNVQAAPIGQADVTVTEADAGFDGWVSTLEGLWESVKAAFGVGTNGAVPTNVKPDSTDSLETTTSGDEPLDVDTKASPRIVVGG